MLNLLPSKFSPEEIANIRHKKNLTQKELADGIGVSKRTVEAWEVGRYNISGAAGKLLALLNLGIVSIDCKGRNPESVYRFEYGRATNPRRIFPITLFLIH